MVKHLLSGEMFFALFLFSGVFKESLELPIDLTALFLILTTLSMLKRLYERPKINKVNILPVIVFDIFICLVLLSIFNSPNLVLTQDKVIKLLLLTTPAFVFPFILFKTKKSLIRFLLSIASISTVLSLLSISMIFQRGGDIGFVGFNDGNYQGLARIAGVGLVILFFLGLLNSNLKKYRLVFLVSITLVLISLLASGSRMPIIAVGLAFIITIASSIKIKNWEVKYPKYYNKIFGLFIILLIPLTWAYKQGYFNSIIFRFETLFQSDGGGASATGRTERFVLAYDMWKENFMFGKGFGSFGGYYTGTTTHDYPHNLFLELLSELGIIGLFTFIILLVVAFIRFYKLGKLKDVRNNNLFITVIIAFLVVFMNSMVSGDINSNRIMLTFISILCILPLVYRKEINKDRLQSDKLRTSEYSEK